MYNVNIYNLSELHAIRDIWTKLEFGPDMSYFQSFHWNNMLAKSWTINEKWMEIILAVVYCEDVPVIIAPLIIIKKTCRLINRKGVYIWGRKGWSDYLNFIYDEYDSEAVSFLIKFIRCQYGVDKFFFEQVRDNTALYKHIQSTKAAAIKSKTSCVSLLLPENVDDYQKMLSKHSRQNIRTARNRASKDGIEFRICYDDLQVEKGLCKIMREARVVEKRKAIYDNKSFLKKLAYKIIERLDYKYPEYLPFYSDNQSKMLTVYDGDTLCAFFNYGIDKVHKTIVLMAVGTNDKYARYSPGILALYSLICSKIEEKDIKCFDFTRGDEPYKFALGGSTSFIYNFELSNIK